MLSCHLYLRNECECKNLITVKLKLTISFRKMEITLGLKVHNLLKYTTTSIFQSKRFCVLYHRIFQNYLKKIQCRPTSSSFVPDSAGDSWRYAIVALVGLSVKLLKEDSRRASGDFCVTTPPACLHSNAYSVI